MSNKPKLRKSQNSKMDMNDMMSHFMKTVYNYELSQNTQVIVL